jgi:FkbM family methyltransferase
VLPRLACEAAWALPRGWSRLLRLAARYMPSLRDIAVDIDICGPMCLDLRETVCSALIKYGYYPHQVAEDRIISAIVKPDMMVFDIGANIGWYSCLAHGLLQGRGKVAAVEPMPRALRLLRNSARSRPLIEVVPSAIGEARGRARLLEAKLLDTSQVDYSGAGEVDVVTIDELAARFGHPDVIKIDVEGAELAAFRGAAQTLSNARPPLIMFEYIPGNVAAFGAYTLLQLIEPLRQGSYSIFRLGHDARLYPIDCAQDGQLTNDYLAAPPGRLGEVRAFFPAEAN